MTIAEAWARVGITLLWGAEALRDLASPAEVLPLRSLFSWRGHWPDELPSNGGRALVTVGLEATLDCLTAADAETWLSEDLRQLMLDFQQAYGGDRALVLWLPSGRSRIRCEPPDDTWMWATPDGDWMPLGRLLFAGAEQDLERISPPGWHGAAEANGLIGLRQRRLS